MPLPQPKVIWPASNGPSRPGYRSSSVRTLPPGDDIGGVSATTFEIQLLAEAGLGRLGALRAATTTPARLLGAENDLGQIAPGFHADLIAIRHDPLSDLAALGRPELVMQAGRVIA